jgi:hypothetical protein
MRRSSFPFLAACDRSETYHAGYREQHAPTLVTASGVGRKAGDIVGASGRVGGPGCLTQIVNRPPDANRVGDAWVPEFTGTDNAP